MGLCLCASRARPAGGQRVVAAHDAPPSPRGAGGAAPVALSPSVLAELATFAATPEPSPAAVAAARAAGAAAELSGRAAAALELAAEGGSPRDHRRPPERLAHQTRVRVEGLGVRLLSGDLVKMLQEKESLRVVQKYIERRWVEASSLTFACGHSSPRGR